MRTKFAIEPEGQGLDPQTHVMLGGLRGTRMARDHHLGTLASGTCWYMEEPGVSRHICVVQHQAVWLSASTRAGSETDWRWVM